MFVCTLKSYWWRHNDKYKYVLHKIKTKSKEIDGYTTPSIWFPVICLFLQQKSKKFRIIPTTNTWQRVDIQNDESHSICPSAASRFLGEYEESKMKERIIDFKKEFLEQTYVQVLFKIGVSFWCKRKLEHKKGGNKIREIEKRV